MVTIQTQVDVQHYVETVPLEESSWRFQFDWNSYSEVWYLTISDANGTVLASGLPILPGLPLALSQGYDTRLPPGALELIDMGPGAPTKPTLTSLGTQHLLIYTTAAELAAL